MRRALNNRLQKLEGGRFDELFEIAPGLLLTGTQVRAVLGAVDGKTRGIPSKAGRHDQG